MTLFSFNSKSKKENNKSSFFIKKYKVSFLAYELLKKYVVLKKVKPEKLDFVHPKNWKPRVIKNISPKAMKTLYRLSDLYEKNANGMVAQIKKIEPKVLTKKIEGHITVKSKKLSPKANNTLKKIRDEKLRYENIDLLIKKFKINKAFN